MRTILLFPFPFNDPHVTIVGVKRPAYLGNCIRDNTEVLDWATGHSEGVT